MNIERNKGSRKKKYFFSGPATKVSHPPPPFPRDKWPSELFFFSVLVLKLLNTDFDPPPTKMKKKVLKSYFFLVAMPLTPLLVAGPLKKIPFLRPL